MASTASNDTFLPRAVLRRSAAIQARLDAKVADANPPPVPDPALAAPAPAEPPATPTPPVDPRESDPAYWKHRYLASEGRLRASHETRTADVQTRDQRIAELESQVSTLQAGAPRSAEAIDLPRYFTPEQIEKFGEEQCRVMASSAQAAAQDQVKTLIDAAVKPIADKQKADQASVATAKQTAFFSRLAELVPDYVDINAKPEWIDWLAQDDTHSDMQRQEILSRHERRGNADAVAKMFKAFLDASKPAAPPVPPVAPNGTGAPAAETPPAAPLAAGGAPTGIEVRDFYKRAALGKVKDEERVAFEARMKLRTGH